MENYKKAIGENVFIMTVTFFYIGKIKSVTDKFITLEKATWIAETGRLTEFLKNGNYNEGEVLLNDLDINLDSIVASTKYLHSLPTKSK